MKGEEEEKKKIKEKKENKSRSPFLELLGKVNCSAKCLCGENCSQPAILCVTRLLPL